MADTLGIRPGFKLLHCYSPVDITAARVAFFPGETWSPTVPKGMSKAVFAPPKKRGEGGDDENAHVTGVRRGRLTAVCFFGRSRNDKSVWLMRCDCGRYTFRKIVGWAKKLEAFDQCIECETVSALNRNGRSHQRHGIRRAKWAAGLLECGFTEAEVQIVDRYKLPAEDLIWLKGALKEIKGRLPTATNQGSAS